MLRFEHISATLLISVFALHGFAAPFVNLSMEARYVGSGGVFSNYLNPMVGQVEYQLIADMAPIGTSRGAITINSLTKAPTNGDGINNLKLDIVAGEGLQTDFFVFESGNLNPDPDATLEGDSWAAGTGASGGLPSGNTLLGIRPIHNVGLQSAIDREVLMTGIFTISRDLPPMQSVHLRWTSNGAGSGKINGGTNIIFSTSTESSGDPFVGFSPLHLFTPEPGSASILLIGLLALCSRRPERFRTVAK